MQRGISSIPEPTMMMNMKLTAIIRAGLDLRPNEVMTASDSSMKEIRNSTNRYIALFSSILITPILSSMPRRLRMIGINVSVNNPLRIHPKKLYADFLFPRFVRSKWAIRSIRNMFQAQK